MGDFDREIASYKQYLLEQSEFNSQRLEWIRAGGREEEFLEARRAEARRTEARRAGAAPAEEELVEEEPAEEELVEEEPAEEEVAEEDLSEEEVAEEKLTQGQRSARQRSERQYHQLCVDHGLDIERVALHKIDKVKHYGFAKGWVKCAAVVDLNGPTVGIIVATRSTVVINVAPMQNFTGPKGGDAGTSVPHAETSMRRLNNRFLKSRAVLLNKKRKQKPWGIIIAAEKNGEIILEDAVEIIQKEFEKFKLKGGVVVATYEPHFSNEDMGSRRSTVFIDGRGDEATVELNGHLIPRPPGRQPKSEYFTYNRSFASNPPSEAPDGKASPQFINFSIADPPRKMPQPRRKQG